MVLEIAPFRLLAGVDDETFLAADKAVQTEVFPNSSRASIKTKRYTDIGG